jgi:aminopeptidase N
MKNKYRLLFLHLTFFLVLYIPSASFAQMFGQEPDERTSNYDVEHIKIEVTLDIVKKTVDGRVTTSIRSKADGLSSFKVDAVGMNIKSVKEAVYSETNNPKEAEKFENIKYDYDKKELTVKPIGSIAKNYPFKYQVEYSITDPEKGLYFISPTDALPNKRYEVWSQGEGEDNRYWFPCYDYPNDKATVEMFITVDKKYQTLSNGKLADTKENPDGSKTWHWVLDKPISSYLVMLAAGNWDEIKDNYLDIPILSYIAPGTKDMAVKSFDRTADMMKFFSGQIGYKYAWVKFLQVAVQDFIYGGMENASAVVLTDVAVYDDKTPPDYTATGLVAHELAHQWWGDVVTCKNWNEIWLNESFATYFQCLYTEHAFGKDEFDYNIFRNGRGSLSADSLVSRKPIYSKNGLTVNTYDKGSVVLNMLRYLLGDSTFWKAMNIYITDNQFQNVTTENLIAAVNKARSGMNRGDRLADYKWFFDEWVYRAGQPEFNVSYDYDESLRELKMLVQQIQRLDTSSVFKTSMPVKIVSANGTVYNEQLTTDNTAQVFTFKLDEKPLYVVFNAGNKILSKVYFAKPEQDWFNQWHYSEDAIDRITAIHGMVDFLDDKSAYGALIEALTKDKFWGVRSEAASVLGKSKQSGVIDMLLEKYNDEADPRVRRTMLASIVNVKKNSTDFIDEKWLANWILDKISKEQSNYAIAEGIDALSQILPKEKIYDAVSGFMSMDSHNEVIRRNTLEALRSSGDKRALDIFMEYAEKGSSSRLRNNAIRGLGSYLDEQKVIDLLNNKLLENSRGTQNAVLSLLEKAKNPSSKQFLQNLYDKTSDDKFKERIKEVMDKIN